jgi:phosphate butyryltransferase
MKSFEKLIDSAKRKGKKRCVVVCAEDDAVLEGIRLAHDIGLIVPVLVGDRTKISEIAKKVHLDATKCEMHDEPDEGKALIKAISVVKERGDFLMKGMLSSSAFLKGVLNKDWGLRSEKILSHIAAFEIPDYHKLLFMSDGGMNPKLNLATRIEILKNAVQALRTMGIRHPKIGLVAASETINPDMPETVDAVKIVEMHRARQIGGCTIDGPFGFDVAVSKKAAAIKKIDSPVAGDVDFILMPSISTANIWAKGMMYFAHTKAAGMVVGAQRPIIMLSRADDPATKLNSIALGVVISRN